jgi:hypothetical protein
MLKFGILVEGPHKPREKSETRKILLPGSEMGVENAVFISILALMARRETQFTRKLCNYEDGPCE